MSQNYSLDQVGTHNREGDCWIIFQDKVYDVSNFKHPGGLAALLRNGGKNATDAMMNVKTHKQHLDSVMTYLNSMCIGSIGNLGSIEK